MAGISGDPGTTAQDGLSGKTNDIAVPEPIRRNPAESVRDGKKHITVRSIRVKDGAGTGNRRAGFDSDGDVVVYGANNNGTGLPFEYDEINLTVDANSDVTQRDYLLSSVTQGVETLTYNLYGHIDSVVSVASAATVSTWVYSYATDNETLVGKAK